MSNFRSRWLDYTPVNEQPSDILERVPAKTDKSRKLRCLPIPDITPAVVPSAETLPRLPWQLEHLISAAACNQLPQNAVKLPSGLVTDLNRYTLGWAAAYLTSDRTEALLRLWQVRRVWQGETLS